MTTCTWSFRRHAGLVLAAIVSFALLSGLVVPRASADQLSDLKAQATALAAKIQDLGRQEDALAQQYDAAQLAVQAANAQVDQATKALAQANSDAAHARKALQSEALDAYVHGGTNQLANATTSMSSANKSLLGAEYVDSLATNQSDTIDRYHLATLRDQAAKTSLEHQQQLAQDKLAQVTKDKQAVLAAQSQLQAAYNQDKGKIATLVAQAQAAAAAAAQREAQARLAAAAAARQAQLAAAQPSQSTGGSVGPSTQPYVPVGRGAAGAIAAAESRLGDEYVWGAAGPNEFDCSGLVMWAYAQVGISLPHYSGAQYADTTHIPMSDLQPGDLVFPSDPGEHVAMYIGGGNIIEAPHTGAVVHIVPLSSWFVLASRVA